jgi:AcrR family transcriptional regulator
VCLEAGVSKGAFYGYFENKQNLLLALLDDDAAGIDRKIEEMEGMNLAQAERLRRFTRWMLERGADPAQMQLRRSHLRAWIEKGIVEGELVEVPANALASVLLALEDGLVLHAALDPSAFRWERIRIALGAILDGLRPA